MSKIKIKYKLDNENKELMGILNKKKVSFKDNEFMTNIEILNNKVIMERENSEIISKYIFSDKGICEIYLKEYDKKLTLDMDIKKLIIRDNGFEINYIIEKENKIFILDYELI